MTQTVSSFIRDIESTPSGPALEGFDHRCGFEKASGVSDAKKDFPVIAIARNPLEIVIDGRSHFIRERKLQGIASLHLTNLDTFLLAPLYIVEPESHDIASAEAVSRNEGKHVWISVFPLCFRAAIRSLNALWFTRRDLEM